MRAKTGWRPSPRSIHPFAPSLPKTRPKSFHTLSFHTEAVLDAMMNGLKNFRTVSALKFWAVEILVFNALIS